MLACSGNLEHPGDAASADRRVSCEDELSLGRCSSPGSDSEQSPASNQASPVRRTYTVNLADLIWNAVVCRHVVSLRACNLIGTGEKYVYYHALHLLHSYKLQPKLLFHDVACMYAPWEQRSAPKPN